MKIFDELKKDLTDAEVKAIKDLMAADWQLMREAFIDQAAVDGFRFPTYTINGRYAVCLVKKRMEHKIETKPKKRGRPPKVTDERRNRI
jgi:hypothetical protein